MTLGDHVGSKRVIDGQTTPSPEYIGNLHAFIKATKVPMNLLKTTRNSRTYYRPVMNTTMFLRNIAVSATNCR